MLLAERNGMAKKSSHVEPVVALCFTAEAANSTLRLNKSNSALGGAGLETSYDGITWSDYHWNNTTGDTLTLDNVGDTVYMRAKTERTTFSTSSSRYFNFVMAGRITASGTIMALLKVDGSRTNAPTYCFYKLFYNCTSLTQAPLLPATTLADSCYTNMFQGCTSLTKAPTLPAETLTYNCYGNMFNGCTSLTQAPALPATTLANSCYTNMFQGCTSLTKAPTLPAETLVGYCYYSMFRGCTSLTQAPALPATTLVDSCYGNMFRDCSNLTSMDVSFESWSTSYTTSWLYGVSASGTFICNSTLPDQRGAAYIPNGWTKVDK